MERTFIAVKPDGVKRGLVGNIIERFERKGYKIIAMKMLQPTKEIAAKHYAEHLGKPFYDRLIWYITSGPIVAMVIEGENVVEGARHIMGATNPSQADVGTIRADFAQKMEYNVVHGSDCVENAEKEISIYFKPEEICADWQTTLDIIMEEEKNR